MKLPRLLRALRRSALPGFAAALTLAALVPLPLLRAQSAATGGISGRILNQGTGEYLRNAVVTVVGTPLATTAEAGGSYAVAGVPAGCSGCGSPTRGSMRRRRRSAWSPGRR